MIQWFFQNWLEVLGAITGLIYLYFSINRLIWLWPLGLITSALYIFVFLKSGLYADMSLQVYYVLVSVYGWIYWIKGARGTTDGQEGMIRIVSKGMKYNLILILITFILTFAGGYFLSRYTDSTIPYWDAFTTSGSVVATWMLARKIIENWIFWIVVDFVAMGTYIYKGLLPTMILFFVYTVLAFIGYRQWKKVMTTIP